QGGVMIIAGDPIGATDALPDVMRAAIDFAEAHGLRLAALGAGQLGLQLYRQAGLRSLYIGDEAIVDTSAFSLEGRPIRKVRQSVSRLEKAGYECALTTVAELDADTSAELDRVSAAWRGQHAERGFSMALDSLRIDEHADTLVLVARDDEKRVRGFLHFVPSYGRPAVSLSLMRRDRQTPNGLTEYMVAKALAHLGEQHIEEVSLNFAAFARILYAPSNPAQRLLKRGLSWADAFFQIER